MICLFCTILPLLAVLLIVGLIVVRRMSRAALSTRQARRRKASMGINAQKDGFHVHEPLRVAFLHPDLGIGGAERLIVDAAMGLQNIVREPLPTSPNGRLSRSSSFANGGINGASPLSQQQTRSRATSLGSTQRSNSGAPNGGTSPALDASLNGPKSPPTGPSNLLTTRRYDVQVFTNYHDPKRAFDETVDGTLKPIIVMADWIPRHIRNKGHVLFASIRMIVAGVQLVLQYQLSSATAFDVVVVDQVAAVMPLFKLLAPSWRIYFYCHFPDQLCDPSRMANLNATIDAKANRSNGTADDATKKGSAALPPKKSLFQQAKHAYRTLFDQVEIISMKAADRVNYNSKFSREVTMGVFPFLKATLDDERDILYPPIDLDKALTEPAKPKDSPNPNVDGFSGVCEEDFVTFMENHRILTSINRFERKKNINLAVEAVAAYANSIKYDGTTFHKNGQVGVTNGRDGSAIPIQSPLLAGGDEKSHLPLALVICGGYDPRLPENVSHHEELLALCNGKYKDIFVPIESIAAYEATVAAEMRQRGENAKRNNGDSTTNSPLVDDAEGITNANNSNVLKRIPVLFLRSCTSRAKYLLLRHASVVLYTPEREHFGIVPVEAMSFGVPVIAVNNGGPVESIGVGDVNGFLRPSDPQQFAEALGKALDPSVSEEVSARASDRAQRVFGLPSFGHKLSVQLEELASMQ